MSIELNKSFDAPLVPEATFEEGSDFIDDMELYAKIEEALLKLEKDPSQALLCGHTEETEDDKRDSTFARLFTEFKKDLEYPSVMTPFEYAIGMAMETGASPMISIYDANLLRDYQTVGQYCPIEGVTLNDALILKIKLSI